ncbi:MAG TPA: hypothetical protein VGF67_09905 [Ktedonobacteraceae bacterium]|jgi:hypothetical protein
MNNFPPSSYPEQNPPYPFSEPGEFVPTSQPPYPPSQPGYPLVPAPRRRRLWPVLVAVLLLLLLAGGAFTYLQVRSTPEKTLQAYCNALKVADAQALYDTLANAARARTSVSQLQQGLRLVAFFVGGVKDCVVNADSIQENSSSATGTVTITTGRGPSTNATIHLIAERGQWKIESNASVP